MSSSASGRFARAIAVAVVLLVIDQLTKSWALKSLVEGEHRHIFSSLHFTLHFNSGMAFSRGQGMGRIIGILAIGVVAVMLSTLRRPRSPLAVTAVGIVVGGALGNVLDRLFRSDNGFMGGSVIDFIDLRWWPIFNVADMGVVIGAGLLILESLFGGRADAQRTEAVASAPEPS